MGATPRAIRARQDQLLAHAHLRLHEGRQPAGAQLSPRPVDAVAGLAALPELRALSVRDLRRSGTWPQLQRAASSARRHHGIEGADARHVVVYARALPLQRTEPAG